MAVRVIARATRPHMLTLAATLAPLLALGTPASSFCVFFQDGSVVIEQESFTGVNTASVDAAVAAAPAHSEALDVKAQIAALPMLLRATVLSIMDAINIERAQHGRAAITPAQAVNAIAAKVDTL
jgi:hypothetical protein